MGFLQYHKITSVIENTGESRVGNLIAFGLHLHNCKFLTISRCQLLHSIFSLQCLTYRTKTIITLVNMNRAVPVFSLTFEFPELECFFCNIEPHTK